LDSAPSGRETLAEAPQQTASLPVRCARRSVPQSGSRWPQRGQGGGGSGRPQRNCLRRAAIWLHVLNLSRGRLWPMYTLIEYPVGVVVEGVVLSMEPSRLRVAAHGAQRCTPICYLCPYRRGRRAESHPHRTGFPGQWRAIPDHAPHPDGGTPAGSLFAEPVLRLLGEVSALNKVWNRRTAVKERNVKVLLRLIGSKRLFQTGAFGPCLHPANSQKIFLH
jgi:hypothetical protein